MSHLHVNRIIAQRLADSPGLNCRIVIDRVHAQLVLTSGAMDGAFHESASSLEDMVNIVRQYAHDFAPSGWRSVNV